MNDLHYAITIGINRYFSVEPDLVFAKPDAKHFHNWVKNPAGANVPDGNYRFIFATDDEEHSFKSGHMTRPTYAEFDEALDEFHTDVRDKVNKGADWAKSRLYIYVAGHGVETNDVRGALLFPNARPPEFWGRHLDLSVYYNYYERQYLFQEVFLFADCCREVLHSPPPANQTAFGNYGPPPRDPRRYIGYAAKYSSMSGEPNIDLHDSSGGPEGFFTKALLEGLTGCAADPISHEVDFDTLAAYIRRRVNALAGEQEWDQEPALEGPSGVRTVICKVQSTRQQVDLLPPPEWPGTADLFLGAEKVSTWSGGRWTVDLYINAIYRVEAEGGERRQVQVTPGQAHVEL